MSNSSKPSSAKPAANAFDADTAAWFFAQSLDLFIVCDIDAVILQVNPSWTRTMGWTAEEMVGRSFYDFVHEDDAPDLRATGREVRGTGVGTATFRMRAKDGTWRWLAGRSQLDGEDRLLATLRDVTDERAHAAEIEGLLQTRSSMAKAAGVASWRIHPETGAFSFDYNSSLLSEHTGVWLDTFETLKRLAHPDDLAALVALRETVATQGGSGEFVIRFVNADGKSLHYKISYRTEPHASGLHTIHGLSQDITAVAEARDQAMRAERLTRSMIEAAPFAAAMFDEDLRHLVISEAWRSMLGLDQERFIGRTLHELFPKARRRFIAAQKRALAGETVRRPEDRLVTHDGRLLWVRWEMQPWRSASGEIGGVLAYMSDVSSLVAARREAQANTRRLKLAVGAAHAAVFEIDYAGKAVWHGPGFDGLAGRFLTYAEMTGGVWPNIHPDDIPAVAQAVATFDSSKLTPMDYRVIDPAGQARWVRAYLEIQHDALGRPRKGVGLLLDIDERKRQELDLVVAQRQATVATEAKSRFLANISHEIRTPMNGVLGVLQLIKQANLDAEDRALIAEALQSGQMLSELLDDLLDFSRIETGQFELHPELLDPTQVLMGVTTLLEPAASAKGLSMTATAEPGLGLIKADPLRLRQALYNIMGNAVKFTPTGSVEARLTRCETPDGPRLRFEVHDTGVGVPEDAQATLFERFEQADGSMSRQFGGSGLGLAITKRLAEMMGGAVGFTSRPGQGSTFWMEIGGEEFAADAKAENDQTDIGEFRVLLVEDNPTNRLVISKLLQALGVTVDCAEDGEQGVQAAARGRYDLVLMDIQMPGIDGMEATRRIRAMDGPNASIPVVAITANVLADQKSNYAAAGMDGVVSKPVSAAALISEINRVTEMRAA
jgi:PAS domain S-box-containing protein